MFASIYRAAIVALPSWSDEAIMSCDLGRLHLAIQTAQEERGAHYRFLMRVQGHQVDEPPPPDQTDEEMVEATRNVMAMFRRRAAEPDDDDV